MSDFKTPPPGTIGWFDLTVQPAEKVRDFYTAVVGWESRALTMEGYDDFVMLRHDNGESVTGICHARGLNKDIPPVWMIYITVENLAESLEAVKAKGGFVIGGVRNFEEQGKYCFIRDPAGAVCALFQYL